MLQWTEIGHIDDIPLPGARVVRTPKGDIAVFRNVEVERNPHVVFV